MPTLSSNNLQQLKVNDLSRLYVKAQYLANFFFGVPIVALVLGYLYFSSQAILGVVVLYLIISVVIYTPVFALLPKLYFKNLMDRFAYVLGDSAEGSRIEVEQDQREVAQQVLAELINMPLHQAQVVFFTAFTGFIAGVILLELGLIPEVMSLIPMVVLIGFAVGFMVSIMQAFLTYGFLESYLSRMIELVLRRYPDLVHTELPAIQRTPLLFKVFFLVLLPTISAQLSVLTIFFSKVYVEIPREFVRSFWFIGVVSLLSVAYIAVIARLFSRNLYAPLARLVDWSKRVTEGKYDQRVRVITNDEIQDVIHNTSHMVEKLQDETILLEEERNKLAIVLGQIRDGVIALDGEYKIVLFNGAAERITGWREIEVTGKEIGSVLHLYNKSNQQVAFSEYYPFVVGSDVPTNWFMAEAPYKLITKLGKEQFIKIGSARLSNSAGQISSIITFSDVTESYRLEEMKLDFVSIAAHELRTPITSILGYVSVLEEESAAKLNAEENQFLDRVMASARELAALIDNLLSVSKIERGALKLNRSSIDLAMLIDEEIDKQKNLAEQKNIDVIFERPQAGQMMVEVDRFWIGQVLMNLISNAIKYTYERGWVNISVEEEVGNVVIHIADGGQGIPSDALGHMFEKFYRVSGVLEQGSKGTGLGLFLSRAVVNAHHGRIWVESELGKGSVFSFSLPVNDVS